MASNDDRRPTKRERREAARRLKTKRNAIRKVADHYYLTPKAWSRRCSHCPATSAVAYRPVDRKAACQACLGRLGIKARKSQAWHDGGAKTDMSVTVRYVEPENRSTSK